MPDRIVRLVRLASWCAVALALLPAGLKAQEVTVQATAAQMLQLADTFLSRGDRERAIQILELLSTDPDPGIRNEARFRRSKLLLAQGSTGAAAGLLHQILAEDPGATAVRLQLAQLLDNLGDKEGAWRQLRAAQAAGLPPDVARLVDRYSEALRSARPMGASFELAIAPDSNISRATRSDALDTVLGDFRIDRDSQATSGLGLSLRGHAFRRIPFGGGNAALVRLAGSADLYRKSRFNDLALDLAAGPELEVGRNRLTLELGVTQRWYGQKPWTRAVRIAAAATRPLDGRTRLWLRGSASLVDNRINDLQDGKSFSASVAVERALSPTSGISLSMEGNRDLLRDPAYATKGWRAGVLFWRDVGRTTFTAELERGRLSADDRLLLFPEERADRSIRLSLGTAFRQLSFAGFAPVTRIVFERNRSTIAFYDYRRTRTEFALVRAF